MKEDSNEDEKTTLISYVSKGNRWIIHCGCSHHMTRDKNKFEKMEQYNVVVLSLVMMHHVL